MRYIGGVIVLFWWFAGIAVAKGFWSTAAAICLPPWALYLVAEKIVERFL